MQFCVNRLLELFTANAAAAMVFRELGLTGPESKSNEALEPWPIEVHKLIGRIIRSVQEADDDDGTQLLRQCQDTLLEQLFPVCRESPLCAFN